MTTSAQIETAETLASYLLRGLRYRIDYDKIPAQRRRSLAREMGDFLEPAAVASRSTEEWVRRICDRFEIEPTGEGRTDGEREFAGSPAYTLLPRRFLPVGTLEMSHAHATPGPEGIAAVVWHDLTRQIDFAALRHAVNRNAQILVTFAMAQPRDGEDSVFSRPNAEPDATPWAATLPAQLQTPRAYRTIITLTSNMAHGADHKSGNVTMFRRERAVDPVSGEPYLRPFVSGNAWRGIWRDEAGALTCRDVGLTLQDIDPKIAHALMAGGTIEAGADGASVDVALRRRVRALLPAWTLFAGVLSQQIMRGVLRVHDSTLICRENAWLLHGMLAPKRPGSDAVIPFEEFRASLKPADDLTQLRLLTRQAHRDIPDMPKDMQMLTETEVLLAGSQMVHAFQLVDLDGVPSVAKSFLSRMLAEFRANAFAGAGNARGIGAIAFDPYQPGDPSLALPSEDEYLTFVAEKRDEIRAFLLGSRAVPLVQVPAPAQVKGKRGKKGAEPTPDAAEGGF